MVEFTCRQTETIRVSLVERLGLITDSDKNRTLGDNFSCMPISSSLQLLHIKQASF